MAEILSAIAVVTSLVFVGLQIRQGAEETALNTRAVQIAAYQDLTAQISRLNTLQIENRQFADLYERVIRGEKPNGAAEQAQIVAFLRMANRQGELAFRQYEHGLIDEASLVSMLAPVRVHLDTGVGQEQWASHGSLDPDYKSYVESLGPLSSSSAAAEAVLNPNSGASPP